MKIKVFLILLIIVIIAQAQSYRISRQGFVTAGGKMTSSQHAAAAQVGMPVFSDMSSASYSLGTVTEVAVPAAQMPQHHALLQNYPNPFNASTTLTWRLPRSARVRIAVYTLLGERVATLFQGLQPAGEYCFHYLGLDQTGRPLASGVYFIRMETEAWQQVVKMAVIR